MRSKYSSLGWVIRLGAALAPPAVIGVVWAVNHEHLSRTAPSRAAAASLRSAATPTARADVPTAPTPPAGGRETILLAEASLASIPAISGATDPDPVASFRQLIAKPRFSPARVTSQPEAMDKDLVRLREPVAKPPESFAAPVTSQPDPRTLRAILDRGVVAYSSSKTDRERTKGVTMIQTAALIGYFPARNLLARNYSQSEAVRSIVPANDAIRYAVGLIMDPTATVENSQEVFLLLAHHFSRQGQIDLFTTQLLNSLRGDSHPRLSHRVDTLLGLLAQVPGACDALARLVITNDDPSREGSIPLTERLRRYIENIPSAGEDEEARQRGLLLFSQLAKGSAPDIP